MVVSVERTDRSGVWLALALCAALFLLGIANFFSPAVRLSSPLANQVSLLGILLLPWVCVALAVVIRPRSAAIVVGTLGLATGIGCGLLAMFVALSTYSTLTNGLDKALLPVSEVHTNAGFVRVYETGTAITDYGLVVRHERVMVPGVLLVRNVYNEYHARPERIELLGPDRVRIHSWRDGVLTKGPDIRVRKLVWFCGNEVVPPNKRMQLAGASVQRNVR